MSKPTNINLFVGVDISAKTASVAWETAPYPPFYGGGSETSGGTWACPTEI